MTDISHRARILANLDSNVLTLTLGNGVAHPLSLAMITELHQDLTAPGTDPQVHVIVIHGPGKIFCAGHDLKEIAAHRADADQGLAYLTELFEKCGDMMQELTHSPKPTIALAEGIATAGGLQLLAACDLAYATPNATFCLPGVNNGGFCTTPAVAVSRTISRKHMMELALSGDAFDAEWARTTGLINRILPANQAFDFTLNFARKLATRHPQAIADGKAALYAHLEMPLDQAYELATRAMVSHFMDPARIARENKR